MLFGNSKFCQCHPLLSVCGNFPKTEDVEALPVIVYQIIGMPPSVDRQFHKRMITCSEKGGISRIPKSPIAGNNFQTMVNWYCKQERISSFHFPRRETPAMMQYKTRKTFHMEWFTQSVYFVYRSVQSDATFYL